MGLNMLYIGFVLFLVIAISHRRDFQNWNEADSTQKGWAIISIIGMVVFGIFSLLLLFGAFD